MCWAHIFFLCVCATDFLCNVPTYLIKFEHSQPLPRSFWPCSLQSLGLEQLESWTGPEPPEGTSLEPLPFEFGLKKYIWQKIGSQKEKKFGERKCQTLYWSRHSLNSSENHTSYCHFQSKNQRKLFFLKNNKDILVYPFGCLWCCRRRWRCSILQKHKFNLSISIGIYLFLWQFSRLSPPFSASLVGCEGWQGG